MNAPDEIFRSALSALDGRNISEAERLFKELLNSQPNHIGALNLLTIVLMTGERFAEAEGYIEKALALNQSSDVSFYNYGIILKRLNRPKQALVQFNAALGLNSNASETWNNRGTVFNDLEQHEKAIADFDKAIVINPRYADAYANKGKSLAQLKHYEEALAACDKAVSLKPGLAEAFLGRGNVFFDLKRFDEALAAYNKALSLKPNLAEAVLGRGSVFFELNRYDEALAAYDKAVSLRSDFAEAFLGHGNVFYALKRYEEAFTAYDKAFSLKSDLPGVEGSRLLTKMKLCDWSNFDTACEDLISSIRDGKLNATPFPFLATSSSSAELLQCAKQWTEKRHPTPKTPVWLGERYNHDRIRVGYLSADFRNHPVAQALAELLEQHDRSRFVTVGLSIGHDDGSELRARLTKAFDHFHDVLLSSDIEVARLIRKLEVDILVKVAPYTEGSRLGILAHRPAPIQVNGFSAWTTGANFIDYVLADPRALPFDEQPYFSEQIVHLPDSYFPHDSTQGIAPTAPCRADHGLPENGFVFCCFNANYKLNPHIFDVWMRLLKRNEGSVLWLSQDNIVTVNNLKREAAVRGVDPSRLVFAVKVPSLSDHWARHQLADIFLDTLPYGAHTTAKDALWAGLPVLTCRGSTFVGRIAVSMLHAVGLNELVTDTLEEYEATALRLAQNPEEIRALRAKLAANRLTHPLFNTERLCRNFEAAYIKMGERFMRGEPPKQFAVDG
jgi:protein O-GlcNAc transferase